MAEKIDLNFYVDNLLKEIKKDVINTNLKCKCGTMIKDIVLNGNFNCPKCYTTVFEKLLKEENRIATLYNAEFLQKIINLKNSNYKGKRPIYTSEYYDLDNKINELNIEIGVSLTEEDYKRCEILKNAVDELSSKKDYLRRKIDG